MIRNQKQKQKLTLPSTPSPMAPTAQPQIYANPGCVRLQSRSLPIETDKELKRLAVEFDLSKEKIVNQALVIGISFLQDALREGSNAKTANGRPDANFA